MIKALSLTGPTASGKTSLSLDIAEKFGLEIISCDSMQIYRGMDIGTAKATVEEQARVKHSLIDFLSPSECYSAEAYRLDAMRASAEILGRGHTPFFVGGTGLYVDTLMRKEAAGSPPSDPELRARLLALGPDELYARLLAVDAESAAAIHKNNVKRVVRALEIFELTGKTKTAFDNESRLLTPDFLIKMVTLDFHNRENLYNRVNMRVDAMVKAGLIDEVEALWRAGLLKPEYTASSAIGYKEIVEYLEGKATLCEACEKIKLSSRRYAKRQLTWFRHVPDAVHLFVDNEDGEIKQYGELLAEAEVVFAELEREIK